MTAFSTSEPASESQAARMIQAQRAYFATGATLPIEFRLTQLKRLQAGIVERQSAIVEALTVDLRRPEFEAYLEISVFDELKYVLKRLKKWVKPRRVDLPLKQWPGSAWIQPEPLGVVLIIGAWNYPLQLTLSPLIGAIAAGNCALVKPSEIAPAMSKVIAELVRDTFAPEYVAVMAGGAETVQALLVQKFDHIFFTGSARVGQIVMAAAAQQLTPVTLELGGKSPCIVDQDVNIAVAAKRIVWGKFVNAGQTCIAPDYLLLHESMKSEFLTTLKQTVQSSFGDDPAQSPDLARIINDRQFDRLTALMVGESVLIGGETRRDERYIAPTILADVTWDSPIMQAEIFGPILPILTYRHIEEAIAQINAHPKPLALYLFTQNEALHQQVLRSTSSGGVCLNDVFLQFAIWGLPFGGVGNSGIGAYHGKASFETFSHLKSVLKKPLWFDVAWRYAPYLGKVGLLKKLIGMP